MRSRVLVGVMVGLLGLTSVPARSATEQDLDGTYVGTIGVQGAITFDTPDASVSMFADGSGPLHVVIEGDQVIGTWSMLGTTFVFGVLGEVGEMGGEGTFDAAGSVIGTLANPNIVGENKWTNSVTVNVAELQQSSSQSDTEDVSEMITDLVIVCEQLMGRYDHRIRQEIEAIEGFEEFLRGYLIARLEGSGLEEEIEALAADVRAWAGAISDAQDPLDVISDGLILVDDTWGLRSEITQSPPCPTDQQFLTELTLTAQDVLATLLQSFPGTTGWAAVTLGLASGAIGAGSAVPLAAADLESALRADVQQRFENLTGEDVIDVNALRDTAAAAEVLGMETLLSNDGVEFTPQDILILAGPENS